MIQGRALLWALCVTGQLIYILKRAYFAVQGPDDTINSYRKFFSHFWPVLIFRGSLGLLLFSYVAFHPDVLWSLISNLSVFGIIVSDKWHFLLTIPMVPPTAFGFGLAIDFLLDWASVKIPWIKERIPSTEFYKHISEIQAQDAAPTPTKPQP